MSDQPLDFTPEDEADLTAAEYVMGLLDSDAHAAAAARADRDPAFATAVVAWENRLTPLVDGVAPVAPSQRVWAGIVRGLPRNRAQQKPWWDSLALWRAATAVATAAAVALAVVMLTSDRAVTPPPERPDALQPLLASTRMQSETGRVLFVITLDQARNRVIVTPVDPDGQPGHSHELWLLPKEGAPVSLGVMPDDASAAMSVTLPLSPDASLAISVEPEGGSPTGLPTGPVVAQGRLTPL
ncbi:anti-sigma factor [Caulobacter mirabilis]|uniref:Anti-sigma factor n=1 Tax=Caulobacter mirabilis TaxID=69666 RepID=A0A2D2AZF7_9CAUL|nr:anti-sigma factor [Caulobacter mirabilis]ATQ43375.1 anti-sigma factor [Caulobacter mirabilis]